jgi:hypothetical protein
VWNRRVLHRANLHFYYEAVIIEGGFGGGLTFLLMSFFDLLDAVGGSLPLFLSCIVLTSSCVDV